ncbi:peroxiredoxin [Rhodobacteraceae bacterium 63075]|nr:peroxiredoxin [Rhodobacteraceae bacterium 63075]
MTDDTQFPAPGFTLPSDDGNDISLSALRGAPVVLFFYPRDNTPGCTNEAKDFSRLLGEFAALGVTVLGVSKDSLASHAKFREKQALTVPLLSDEHGSACEDFGVWKEKKMYGKTFMGIERSTFLIDGEGQVVRAWRKVKVPGHAEEVLAAAKAL